MLKLLKLIEGMKFQCDILDVYINLEDGNIVYISEEDQFELEYLDKDEDIPEHLDVIEDFLYRHIPGKHEIKEYSMMENFLNTLDNNIKREKLSQAIQGIKAFIKFKDAAIFYDVIELWYIFKDKAYGKVALNFCKNNKIEFIDDCS